MNDVIPFILGHGPWCATRAARMSPQMHVYDVLAPDTLAFFHLVNAGNALAYGGAAMPAWVQLDCACLPTGMVGFGLPRNVVEPTLWVSLMDRVEQLFGKDARSNAERWTGLIPLSEYACVSTPLAGEVVGFSLFSLRRGLGVRTKALGLLLNDATRQTGIAQVTNASLRTHTALGPLEVIAPRVASHSQPDTTFVYRLHIQAADSLRRLAAGEPPPPRRGGLQHAHRVDTTGLARVIAEHGPHAIVDTTDDALMLVPWPS